MSYCLVSFAVEMWMLRKLHVKTIENNDLLTLSNQARRFKKLFTLFTILSAVPMLILSVGLFAHTGYDHFPSFGRFLAVLCFTLVFFVGIGVIGFRHVTRPCDDIIQKIEASENPTDKRTGFGSRQKWFCVAMFVMFLGLDVWAYMIVASHLKLPPMWRQVTYTRTGDSLPVEDDLSIWVVFADTLISAEDVPALTKLWQEDPSLVVAKGYGDDGETVNLYALKMASPEGPLVSSKRLGGKPVVEKIRVREPQIDRGEETIPVVIFLTPEAKQLWSEQFDPNEETKSIDIALVIDGMVYHKTNFTSLHGVTNKSFSIGWIWRKDKLDDFCARLMKQ